MKYITRALLLIIAICSLSACQNNSSSQEEEITVVLDWVPNTNHTGLYVALENGYYQENGLTVTIMQPPEDGAVSLVASGKADIGVSFQESMAPALDQNMPIEAVAAIVQHNDSGIISLQKTDIDRPKKLTNHRLATWDSDLFHALVGQIVDNDGGSYSDVELIYSNVTDIQTALETSIDAVWVYYGWDGIALENAGYETNYFSFREIDPLFDFYTPVLITNHDFLSNSPETAKAFLRATAKGYEYAAQHPQEAADILLKYAPELDSEMVHASQLYMSNLYIDDALQWGIIDASRWNNFYQWMFDHQLLETNLAQSDQNGFTNDFLPKEME